MVKSGIPVPEALSTLKEETKSGVFKNVLGSVLAEIQNGKTLATALAKQKGDFDEFYLSLIEVGEESGTLEQSLEYLAKQMSKDYAIRKKVQGALMYPAIVFAATFGMGGFIAFYILPKLVDFFAAFETKLPLATQILLWIANTIKDYGLMIIAGAIFAICGFLLLIQIPVIKFIWHKLMLKFPLFGKLLLYGQLVRFCRNFGTMITSGVPIARSLETTAGTLSNLEIQADVREVASQLAKGRNIGDILMQRKFRIFPLIVSKMISVGEKTGKLDEVLIYLGDYYEEEIDDITKNLTTILEPVMLIIIGIAVTFIALAIISPIYELTGSIQR